MGNSNATSPSHGHLDKWSLGPSFAHFTRTEAGGPEYGIFVQAEQIKTMRNAQVGLHVHAHDTTKFGGFGQKGKEGIERTRKPRLRGVLIKLL